MSATLLIVEDDIRNMRLVRALLTAHGFLLLCANDGQSGVDLAIANLPDIILMDIQLPVIDGLVATQMLQADERTREIPVIALTAQAMRGDRERILQSGCSDYVTKPVHLPDLLETIDRWIPREAAG